MIASKVQLDAVKFLKTAFDQLQRDVDHAYPGGYFDKDLAHAALSAVLSDVCILQKFLEALEPIDDQSI